MSVYKHQWFRFSFLCFTAEASNAFGWSQSYLQKQITGEPKPLIRNGGLFTKNKRISIRVSESDLQKNM